MIPTLAEVGRVIVPDLIGFGRSDKPVNDNAYSYRSHARWLRHFIEQLDLRQTTLVCQDWGGLLGLRVLSETPGHFSRLVAMNTGIPDGRDSATVSCNGGITRNVSGNSTPAASCKVS
jgi:haloalkane dehalogenase